MYTEHHSTDVGVLEGKSRLLPLLLRSGYPSVLLYSIIYTFTDCVVFEVSKKEEGKKEEGGKKGKGLRGKDKHEHSVILLWRGTGGGESQYHFWGILFRMSSVSPCSGTPCTFIRSFSGSPHRPFRVSDSPSGEPDLPWVVSPTT